MGDKFVYPSPTPTPYERELLEILIEECAEVQQRATEALRFGLHEVQPGNSYDNSFRLGLEIGDLSKVVRRCVDARIVSQRSIVDGVDSKRKQLAKFMQNNPTETTP